MTRRPQLPNTTAPEGAHPVKYYSTMIGCAGFPLVVALLLPQPWRDALLPLGEFMLTFVVFFGLALALHTLDVLWQLLQPQQAHRWICPGCHTLESDWFRFDVVRVAPALFRIRCPECGEGWLGRHGPGQ